MNHTITREIRIEQRRAQAVRQLQQADRIIRQQLDCVRRKVEDLSRLNCLGELQAATASYEAACGAIAACDDLCE